MINLNLAQSGASTVAFIKSTPVIIFNISGILFPPLRGFISIINNLLSLPNSNSILKAPEAYV